MSWDKAQNIYVKLSMRERMLTLISAVGLIIFSAINFLLMPIFEEYTQLKKVEKTTQASIQAINVQVDNIKKQLEAKPVEKIQRQLDNLNRQYQNKIKDLEKYKLALVSSDDMATLIEEVVEENKNLLVVSLVSKAPTPILIQSNEGKEQVLLYKHAIDVKLQGQYFALLAFMKKIETQEKSILWNDIDYKVGEYPNAILSFEIYTISTDKEFIGVKK